VLTVFWLRVLASELCWDSSDFGYSWEQVALEAVLDDIKRRKVG